MNFMQWEYAQIYNSYDSHSRELKQISVIEVWHYVCWCNCMQKHICTYISICMPMLLSGEEAYVIRIFLSFYVAIYSRLSKPES